MNTINKNLMNKTGIYIIINVLNGNRYIGSSINLYNRLYSHIWDLNSNKHPNQHLQNAWNKYGEDAFEYNILEICDSSIQFEREHFYVKMINPEYNLNGVNAESINHHTTSTKEKISQSILQSYSSGKLKKYLEKTSRHSIPCFVYNIKNWELIKCCKNFAEADEVIGMNKAVRSDLLEKRIFKETYIVSEKKYNKINLKNFVCKHLLKYSSKNFKKEVYLICEINNEIFYFKTIQSLIDYINCSSKSTISRHLNATKINPYIIPNTNIKIYFSEKFIPYGRDVKEFTLESESKIGESCDGNTEVISEIKKSETPYSVESEPL